MLIQKCRLRYVRATVSNIKIGIKTLKTLDRGEKKFKKLYHLAKVRKGKHATRKYNKLET